MNDLKKLHKVFQFCATERSEMDKFNTDLEI